ncbi:unnamed protein product [marine sediment metagenome]|uniref:Uncharacterized protein n=1 Tax=marine sediment metagenome TaxID=412755 RepID=X1T9V1_9ZZZZ
MKLRVEEKERLVSEEQSDLLCLFSNSGGAGRRPLRGDVSPFKILKVFPETRS